MEEKEISSGGGVFEVIGKMILGAIAGAILGGACWYGCSFMTSGSSSAFPMPIQNGRDSGLSIFIGLILGGGVGFLSSAITSIFKTYKSTSIVIGAMVGLGPLVLVIILPSGGVASYILYSLFSLALAGAAAGLIGSAKRKQQ